ncbi:MAG TPA: transglutaminase-like domain-containing protein [Xanthomonadaceae bacterium]|nr:transglutaminase-like domain-containing protein [Xanthomonadaceae bacterium]
MLSTMSPQRSRTALSVAILAAALLCTAAALARGAEAGESWHSVHLQGRHVGYLHTERAANAAEVTTGHSMHVTIERNGQQLVVTSRERTVETPEGEPISFTTEIDAAGSHTRIEGRIDTAAGTLRVRTGSHDHDSEQTLPWPQGALLFEGLRLLEARAGLASGTRYQALAFDPASLSAMRVDGHVIGPERVDIHGRQETLTAVEQQLDLGGAHMVSRSWLDADGEVRRMRMPLMGLTLETIACNRECATAPPLAADVFESTLVDSPRPLTRTELGSRLSYRVVVESGSGDAFGQVPGQRVSGGDGGELLVQIDPVGGTGPEPTPRMLEPTRWLESDAPELVEMAAKAISGERDAARQMARLERFVRRHVKTKSLRVGYASALETARSREGDCTEHAVLLAALGRAAGIPTQVVTGLVYAPWFGGRESVFVPHAWVIAHADGHWRGYDAAQPRFDAGHLGLSIGDGDPFRFYSGVELLGRLQIAAVESTAVAAPAGAAGQ